jgi:glutamate racemase
VTQACPGLVEQVEAGELSSTTTRELVARYTARLLARGADTIVLGCTHYAFLKPLIADLVGARVQLIDTGDAVARQVVRRVPGALIGRVDAIPEERFWTTGDAHSAGRIMSQLWGHSVAVEAL